jgi:hypothetical protein
VLASQREVLPDLIGGQTVEEMEQDLQTALPLVAQTRSRLELKT